MKNKIKYLLATLLMVLVGCTTQQANTPQSKLKLVATFYPVYELTKQIVGDTADVQLLTKAGTEVHSFEPSAKDIATIEEADAFIYANENMETWISDIQKNVSSKNAKVKLIKATDKMLLLPGAEEEDGHDHSHEGHHHAYDPHVWVSPYRLIQMVRSLKDGLVQLNAAQKETYEKNAQAYIAKLEEIDKQYQEHLKSAKQKSFVTQHAAFNYLAIDYGLNQVSVLGLSPEVEPSAKRLTELAEYIKENSIQYIYFEQTASSALAKTLADETGVKTAVLNPLESLTEKEIADGKNLISVLNDNLTALRLTTDVAGKEIKAEEHDDHDHDHDHKHEEKNEKSVYKGYFEDKDIKDRPLSDYACEWQSVYPFLLDGTFDQVWDYKSKAKDAKMTAQEYKDYYTIGYKTDVEKIVIKDDEMTFVSNGVSKTFKYRYSGYKVLTYKKGNRGVRFLFETDAADAGRFKYVQFSDHKIAPEKTDHFHIYFGEESHAKLLEELTNWPTYYPSNLSAFEIAQEMLAH